MRLSAAIIALALLGSACSTQGLEFTEDERVRWVTEERSTVSLPLTLEWETTDYEVTGPDGQSDLSAGYFAVFIDRMPMRRNATLLSLAADDDSCQADPACPDTTWFVNRQVYVVEEGTSVTIEQLPMDLEQSGPELHDFVLVLLDGQGRRQGESAHRIRLIVERDR
jgi:hypothetical protein